MLRFLFFFFDAHNRCAHFWRNTHNCYGLSPATFFSLLLSSFASASFLFFLATRLFFVPVFHRAPNASSLYLIRYLFAWAYSPVLHSSHFLFSLSLSMCFSSLESQMKKTRGKKVARTMRSRCRELAGRVLTPRFSSSFIENTSRQRMLLFNLSNSCQILSLSHHHN